jgi:hypothetical protein
VLEGFGKYRGARGLSVPLGQVLSGTGKGDKAQQGLNRPQLCMIIFYCINFCDP